MPPDAAIARRGVPDDWRDGQARRRDDKAAFGDRWLGLWGSAVLIAMLLYMLIGQAPYQHEVPLDPDTGTVIVSPFNRYVWLGLFAVSAPILWFRRGVLVEAIRRLWPLVVLYCWFAATTTWALDPGVANKRFLLYLIATGISLAVCLGIRNGHRLHQTMAIACAILVGIDFGSWVFLYQTSMTPLGLAAIHTHKNTLGSVMMFCGLICGTYLVSQKTFAGRLFWGAVLCAAFALLIASKSKTSLAIFVVAALVAPILVLMMRQRTAVLWGLAGLAVAVLGAGVLGWVGWSLALGHDPLAPFSQVTFTMRTDVWRFALSQWAQHPWKGLGFGSFWDIDPARQPSLQTDEWFAKPDAFTNEAHNGYIDLGVTTGILGLVGGLALLFRWMFRSLAMMRVALFARDPADRETLPYGIYLGLFPLLFFAHNFMESSYFTANSTFGTLILLIGIDVDLRWPERTHPGGLSAPDFVRG